MMRHLLPLLSLMAAAAAAQGCWYDQVCDYYLEDPRVQIDHDGTFEDQTRQCQMKCQQLNNDHESGANSTTCNHFTMMSIRNTVFCYMLESCDDRHNAPCLEMELCSSGPVSCSSQPDTTTTAIAPTDATETPTDAPAPTSTGSPPSSGCPHHNCVEDGLFPEGQCSPDFCQCEHGLEHPMACMDGLFFNPESSVCDWAWNIPECEEHTTSV